MSLLRLPQLIFQKLIPVSTEFTLLNASGRTLTDRVGPGECASILAQSFTENDIYDEVSEEDMDGLYSEGNEIDLADDFRNGKEKDEVSEVGTSESDGRWGGKSEGNMGSEEKISGSGDERKPTVTKTTATKPRLSYEDYESNMAIEEPEEGRTSDKLEEKIQKDKGAAKTEAKQRSLSVSPRKQEFMTTDQIASSQKVKQATYSISDSERRPYSFLTQESLDVERKAHSGGSGDIKKMPTARSCSDIPVGKKPDFFERPEAEVLGKKEKRNEKRERAELEKREKDEREKREKRAKEKEKEKDKNLKFRLSRKHYSAATAMSAPKHRSPALMHMMGVDKRKEKVPKVLYISIPIPYAL